jgi:hypothetical protein
MHYFDFNQKIFEVGQSSSLALMTWGLRSFGATSIRSMAAALGDSLSTLPAATLLDSTDL